MDAFISWTGRDRDVKNVLVEKLHEAGISCWDSEEYCTSDYSQECIDAIKRCSLFIVIVSDASMETGYVKNEIIAARKQEEAGLLNMLVYKITDAPYTDDFEFQLNHISFVCGNLVQRQENLRGESSIDILVTRAQRLLELRKDGSPEKPFTVKIPQVHGWTITGGAGYFVENSRDDILEAMEDAFRHGNAIVLTEFIGFGKRSVIRKYLAQHPDRFSSAIMVDNQCGSLRNFLLSGLQFSNLNPALFNSLEGDALIDAKLRQLEKLEENVLLVIPDLELPEDRELYQRLLSLRCRIILLTQGSAESCYDLLPVIRVGKMEDPYLSELFFHHYTRAFEEDRELLKAPLEDFFEQIGGHTKTVELTASVLNRDMAVMPERVPQFLSFRGAGGLELKDRILDQLSHIFVLEQLTDGQKKALVLAACLAVPYLSEQHFRQLLADCGAEDWQEILELDSRRWLDLDLKNGTVSIEPLVAQIVLQRFPEEQEALMRSLLYLDEAYIRQLAMSDSPGFLAANAARMEHFFRITNLPVLAELAEILRQFFLGNHQAENMALALRKFHEEYPAEDFSESPEELEFSNVREAFCYIAQHQVRSNLLHLCKLCSSGIVSLALDFSASGSRAMSQLAGQQLDFSLDIESTFGMTREEMMQWLDSLREQIRNREDCDDEDVYVHFILEALSVLDSVYRRDHRAVLVGMGNLLAHLETDPDILQDADLADMFQSCAVLLAQVYYNSRAYAAATQLCEKALAYPSRPVHRLALLKVYIPALCIFNRYDDQLYASVRQLLRLLEEEGENTFENRQELLLHKQEWMLFYAESLAKGGEGSAAREQFAKACKGTILAPDRMVDAAWVIGESLIRGGDFEEAQQFLEQHLSEEKQAQLESLCDAEHQETLVQIRDLMRLEDLQQSDFASNADPEQHISYYHAYSRKNNSILDRKYCTVADQAMEYDFEDLTDEEITAHAKKLRSRSARESLLKLAPEAFALASEAGFRVLGYRHHYVQYMGAAAMADGKIAEILNGEGKTYTIVPAVFLHWLFGKKVYVVDECDYLTQRNHDWMRGVYQLLGMTTFHVRHYRQIEEADVYYITLKNLIATYLSQELYGPDSAAKLKLDVAVIDEADTVLVDEAKRHFCITQGQADSKALWLHQKAWRLVETLDLYGEDFSLQDGRVTLQPAIYPKIEKLFLVSGNALGQLPQMQKIEALVRTAIACRFCYEENKDYFIHKGVPVREDRVRGVFTPLDAGTSYFLCKQNGLPTDIWEKQLLTRSVVLNSICLREFFRKFKTVCGTTATAVSFRKEFREIYDLEYVAVPPHSPVVRQDTQSPLYTNMRYKDRAILEMVKEKHALGQPILLITQSVEESEKYHRLLKRIGIPHGLLNAKNSEEAANILSTAGMPGSVLVASALVSRGADIRLGGNPERQTLRTLVEMGTDISGLEDFLYRLPTAEQKESELYKKYHSILEQNRRLAARQRQEVVALGGLCVIGTSFFPEPRNEQQTRGRCGRQGDVGESRVFCSMDDPGLKEILSTSLMEMMLARWGDLEEIDSKMLASSMKTAQKRIHTSCFAEIRSANDKGQAIEKYRKDFLGLQNALAEGLVGYEELVENWAGNKTVAKQLLTLQQGQPLPENETLQELYRLTPDLKTARGMQVPRALQKAYWGVLEPRFSHLDEDARQQLFTQALQGQLRLAWQSFIEIVDDVSSRLNRSALNDFLEQEKDRLLRWAVERLIYLRPKKNDP